ncbi:MAG: DJ-1/PfpI family protein [Solirubrobacterales bacterium]|nr:DJ-1/PfpI family protein [Solirubrobacterales bacterium]
MNVAIPIFDGLTALDAVGPYEVLSRLPDANVRFLAAEKGPVRTQNGMLALLADLTFDELGDPDVIVVPGGHITSELMGDDQAVGWLRRAHESSAWTTSVCTGSLLLAAAGILDGLRATSHWLALDTLARYGAHPVSERVVEQGKVITAAGVSAGIDMALILAERIAGEQIAQAIQLSIEYDPQPPFDCGSPVKAPQIWSSWSAQPLGHRRGSRLEAASVPAGCPSG